MWGRRRAVDRGPLILVGVTLTCLALVAALSTSPDQSASAASAAFAPGIGSATFVATPDADPLEIERTIEPPGSRSCCQCTWRPPSTTSP
jgi:hypothetical protein